MSSSESRDWPFVVLDIQRSNATKQTVRKAYAVKLKKIDQVSEGGAFQELRRAYEAALSELQVPAQVDDQVETDPQEAINPPAPVLVAVPHMPTEKAEAPTKQSREPDFEFETDWHQVHELCDRVALTREGETDEKRISMIWQDKIFDDPDALQTLETTVFEFTYGKLEFDAKGIPTFPKKVSIDYLEFLDQTFHWFSDSVQFEKLYSTASDVTIAASKRMDQAGIFEGPIEPKSWKNLNRRLGKHLRRPVNILISIGIAGLVANIYSHTPEADDDLVGVIRLYGILVVHLAQIPFLALAYITNVDAVTRFLQVFSTYAFSLRAWLAWGALMIALILSAEFFPRDIWQVLFYTGLVFPAYAIIAAIGVWVGVLMLSLGIVVLTTAGVIDNVFYWLANLAVRTFYLLKRRSR
jgi:hypothetical protein